MQGSHDRPAQQRCCAVPAGHYYLMVRADSCRRRVPAFTRQKVAPDVNWNGVAMLPAFDAANRVNALGTCLFMGKALSKQ
jgi:hypothetical protein